MRPASQGPSIDAKAAPPADLSKFPDVAECCAAGDAYNALKRIDAHIKAEPHDRDAHFVKLQILEYLNRWDDAIKCSNYALRCKVESPAITMIANAKIYAKAGNAKKALLHVDKAEKEYGMPRADACVQKSIITTLLSVLGHADMLDESLRYALEACHIDEQNATYHSVVAAVLFTKFTDGPYPKDLDLLRKSVIHGKTALKLGDRNCLTYYEIGRALSLLEKYDSAIKYFKRAPHINPNFTNAFGMIGGCMAQQNAKPKNHYHKAIKYIDKALGDDASLTFLRKGRAFAHLNLGNVDAAILDLEKFLDIEPENVGGWLLLMTIYERAGDAHNAARCRKKAVEIEPNVATISKELCDRQHEP